MFILRADKRQSPAELRVVEWGANGLLVWLAGLWLLGAWDVIEQARTRSIGGPPPAAMFFGSVFLLLMAGVTLAFRAYVRRLIVERQAEDKLRKAANAARSNENATRP